METTVLIEVMGSIGDFILVVYCVEYSMRILRDKIRNKDIKNALEITRRILFTKWH